MKQLKQFTVPALMSAATLWCGASLGWGLVVPGQLGSPNDYYSVKEGKLYRYFCKAGVEVNEENCKLDTTFARGFKQLHEQLEAELNAAVRQNRLAIRAEKGRIVNDDLSVKTLRTTISNGVKRVQQLEQENATLAANVVQVKENLKTVEAQLALVNKELLQEGLPQDKLSRLIEQRKNLLGHEKVYRDQISEVDAKVARNRTEITQVNDGVAIASQKLVELIPTIPLVSAKLTELIAERNTIEAEMENLPDLQKRLEEPFAYELSEWVATGSEGVEELVNRFLAMLGCPKRPTAN